jgi:hypothetical protein
MELGKPIYDKVFNVVNYSIGDHVQKSLVGYDNEFSIRRYWISLGTLVNDSINSINFDI